MQTSVNRTQEASASRLWAAAQMLRSSVENLEEIDQRHNVNRSAPETAFAELTF